MGGRRFGRSKRAKKSGNSSTYARSKRSAISVRSARHMVCKVGEVWKVFEV